MSEYEKLMLRLQLNIANAMNIVASASITLPTDATRRTIIAQQVTDSGKNFSDIVKDAVAVVQTP